MSLQQRRVNRSNGRQSMVFLRMQFMVAGSTTHMISEYSNLISNYSSTTLLWKDNSSYRKSLVFLRAAMLEISLEWSIRCLIKTLQHSLDFPRTLTEVFRDSTAVQSSVSWSSWQLWAQVNLDLTWRYGRKDSLQLSMLGSICTSHKHLIRFKLPRMIWTRLIQLKALFWWR